MYGFYMIGFISLFIVFGAYVSSFQYTERSFVSNVIDVDGSYRDKRPSDVSNSYSSDLINGYDISKRSDASNGYDVPNDEGYDVSNNDGYDVPNDDEYDVPNDDEYDVPNGEGYDVSNDDGYDVSNDDGYDVSNDDGYDVSNDEGYDVSETYGYNRNGVLQSKVSKARNEIELRRPCVNITTNHSVCLCSLDGKFTDCSRNNLTFLPIIPPTTTTLNMSGNSLRTLDQDSLTNISQLSESLRSLDVSKNQISYIGNGSLSNFIVLKTLNVSVNPISNTAIENLTSGISTELKNLFLEGLDLKVFPYQTMPHLNNTKLSTLSVKYNDIKDIETSKIFPQTKLFSLDLSFNSIRYINITHSENLKLLSLSSNDITGIPHFCDNGTKLPNLHWLFLDDNSIRKLKTERLDCLDNLQLLNISATRIEYIPANAFSGFKSLQRLTLERTQSLQHIRSYAFNSSSLERVYIRFNHLQFNRKQVDTSTILKSCPKLLKLDLSGNLLSMMKNADWTNILQNLTKLKYLDISNSGLMYLPKAIHQYVRNLRTLHIANTGVHFIPKGYFSPLKKLRVLLLNGNKFTTITAQDFPPSFTYHLWYINLAFNPFVCNCDLLWFIEFAKKYRHKMNYFPKNYECSKIKWKTITHFKISKKSCLLKKQTAEIIQCTCIAMMLLMLVMSGVYRYRWHLRYMLYVLKFNRRRCDNNRDLAFTHDVYISSTESNYSTVDLITTELESKGLRVYFPHRDAMLGRPDIKNNLEKIDDSKYVMLCLSNGYSQDNRCEFEANMALQRSTHEHTNTAMIVVVLEEICSVNVTKIIHKLTRTGDYLKWNENRTSDNLFWRQLGERIELQ